MSDKLTLVITNEGGKYWNVWITLPDHDPIEDPFGFVAGCGDTRDAAVADAVWNLELAVDALQSPPGTIEEREL